MGVDIWDSIDDLNDTSGNPGAYPVTTSWTDANVCGYLSVTAAGGQATWEPITALGSNSVFEDKITKTKWSRGGSPLQLARWEDAISHCHAFNHGGLTDWRLPTQKELTFLAVI
jgi:hypothetical protein